MCVKVIFEVLAKAIECFGLEAQKLQSIEECAELIDALCKERSGRSNCDDVITEIADVVIMCWQLSLIYGVENVNDEILRKVSRLEERICEQLGK